jgi:hypothetical protein
MLREHYPIDKFFEEVLGYIPDLSPELVKIVTGMPVWKVASVF